MFCYSLCSLAKSRRQRMPDTGLFWPEEVQGYDDPVSQQGRIYVVN